MELQMDDSKNSTYDIDENQTIEHDLEIMVEECTSHHTRKQPNDMQNTVRRDQTNLKYTRRNLEWRIH